MDSKSINELLGTLDFQTVSAADDGQATSTPSISGIAYRSDAVQPGNAFFCIPGLVHDGHDFAAAAVSRGAVVLVVEHPVDVKAPQVLVADSRQALALASCVLFDDPSSELKLVAVTGTNGKTTTTYLVDWIIRYALAQSGDVRADEKTGLIGTVETRIGRTRMDSHHTTPESYDLQALLRSMRDAGVEYATMEASSHAIALDRVAGVHVAVAAFTNLTQDHLDFHADMQEYFQVKARLFSTDLTEDRVINIDAEYGRRLARNCKDAGLQVLTTGFAEDADLRAQLVHFSPTGTELTVQTSEGVFEFSYPLIGEFNVENVLLAAGIARRLGFNYPTIFAALGNAPQVPGRLESVSCKAVSACDGQAADRIRSLRVFVDYSHTPDSIEKALAALNELKTNRVGIVFGCGGDRDRGKRPLMGRAACAADFVVVTSDNPRSEDPQKIIADILPGLEGFEAYEVVADRRQAIACALESAEPGDIVLIAGKGHEDYQLVGDTVLSFDDRLVAAEELEALWRRLDVQPDVGQQHGDLQRHAQQSGHNQHDRHQFGKQQQEERES